MKLNKYLITFLVFSLLSADEANPYVKVANELLVRKKLATKLPNAFNKEKFEDIANRLDELENITLETRTYFTRIQSSNPEFHWCYAQANLLIGNADESLAHYRKFKVLTLDENISVHTVFEKDISELELAIEKQQAELAKEINFYVQALKNKSDYLNTSRISTLQTKLNTYNEISSDYVPMVVDGVLGTGTKEAIFDFEENNPYIKEESVNIASNNTINITSPGQITPISSTQDYTIASSQGVALKDKIVIDSEKINSLPVSTIAEVLEYVVGLNVKRQGMSDVLSSVSTLGGTGEQTLILLDGLKISNQQTLHHDLDLPVNLNDIKSIEIYKGSAARKYGTGALSGVINIITKDGKENETYIATNLGSYGVLDGNMALSMPIGNSHHNLSYSYLQSSKYNDAQSDDQLNFKSNFFYKYSLKDNQTYTSFSLGYQSRGDMINNFLSSTYDNQYEQNATRFFNSRVQWDFGNVLFESNTHWFDYHNEIAYNKATGNWKNYKSSEIGFDFNTIYAHQYGKTSAGFRYNRENNSNTYINDYYRGHVIMNLDHAISTQSWDFDFGISTNSNDVGYYLAPGYQLVHHLSPTANIYHKYNYGFRLPSFYELYASDHRYVGDEDLNTEKTSSFEYGVQLYGEPMTLTFASYYKNSTDVIDWYKATGSLPYWTSANITDVVTSGNSFQLELYPSATKMFSLVERLELGYNYLNVEHNGSEENYRYLSNYLKHQIVIGTTYSYPYLTFLTQSVYLRYEQPTASDNRTIVDTQLNYQIWKIDCALNINNLLNVEYEDVEDVTLPGTSVSFNLKFKL